MGLPLSSASIDRRDDVLRLLADAPEGLSDAALAGAMVGVRSSSVNTLCRRMAAAGVIERVGTRPIRNRLAVAASTDGDGPEVAPAPDADGDVTPDDATLVPPADPTSADPASADPAPPALAPPAHLDSADPASADPAPPTLAPHTLAPPALAPPAPVAPVLGRDAAQAWSRPVNVQAAVASWLTDRGATIRAATGSGDEPARDLVVSLDGDVVHVEITGWPPDGARTHPTTIAGDWFAAAEHAAHARRQAHPHARIVIALPDTRRYRSLRERRADALAGARAEVWFVDPTGTVEPAAAGTA